MQARVTFNLKTRVGLQVFSMRIHRNDNPAKYLAPFDCYITFHPCNDGIKIQNYGDVSLLCVCMLIKAAWRFVLKNYRWFKCFAKIQHSFDNILKDCLAKEVFWHFSVVIHSRTITPCWLSAWEVWGFLTWRGQFDICHYACATGILHWALGMVCTFCNSTMKCKQWKTWT